MVTKTAFTFKRWYWGDGYEKPPPQWWTNFLKDRPLKEVGEELSAVAEVRYEPNGDIRVLFNSPEILSFFILRWS
jgi:hypothetical protein